MSIKALIQWSQSQFTDLPWRKNRSLYGTLVSEIMLQQTTVGTVKNHYERFLKRFPTLKSLAEATEEELIVAWKGLGYYRRARNLKKIAESLFRDHEGEFPHDIEHLMEIPGIGPYTANAIVGIGMDKRALAVDANLERVIARLYGIKLPKGVKLQKEISAQFTAKKIFTEKVSFRALNESLMDLGRTFCQARKASCELCPLKKDCKAFASGKPLSFPVDTLNKKIKDDHELHLLRICVIKNGKILAYKKSEKEWLAGQYEVPTFILSTTDEKLSQYPKLETTLKAEFSFTTGITKYKIKNSVCLLSEKEFKKLAFPSKIEWRQMNSDSSNFSTATLKAMAKLSKSSE